jgi:hypothetical protein
VILRFLCIPTLSQVDVALADKLFRQNEFVMELHQLLTIVSEVIFSVDDRSMITVDDVLNVEMVILLLYLYIYKHPAECYIQTSQRSFFTCASQISKKKILVRTGIALNRDHTPKY